jgi:hypothetical protein
MRKTVVSAHLNALVRSLFSSQTNRVEFLIFSLKFDFCVRLELVLGPTSEFSLDRCYRTHSVTLKRAPYTNKNRMYALQLHRSKTPHLMWATARLFVHAWLSVCTIICASLVVTVATGHRLRGELD